VLWAAYAMPAPMPRMTKKIKNGKELLVRMASTFEINLIPCLVCSIATEERLPMA